MKRECEVRGLGGVGGHSYEERADENRSGFVVRAGEDSCMCDRADGAIVSGKFRAIRMDVAHLHKAGERYRQDAQETQQPERQLRARLVSPKQIKRPHAQKILQSVAMHHGTAELLI